MGIGFHFDSAVGLSSVPGAAATIRKRWPHSITDPGGANSVAHLGAQTLDGWTVTAYAGGTNTTIGNVAGSVAIGFNSAAAGVGFGVADASRYTWFTERTGGPVVDEWSCYEARCTMQVPNLAGANALDAGLAIFCGNTNQVLKATNPGVILYFSNAQQMKLASRLVAAGALVMNDTIAFPAGFDITQWHTYALRVVTGSNSTDPVLTVLIDGSVVTAGAQAQRISWTNAAGLLPANNAVAGQVGYTFSILNTSDGNVASLRFRDFTVTVAQSEAALT